ncbi:hypothetical protein AURDEDRAFT_113474 [Auricularia subglabra TFB-10046 SS5]|nr:hypothetical protein AURDEDRAFT_113474 [Auricularia subglabra TFB-10046 SS5]
MSLRSKWQLPCRRLCILERQALHGREHIVKSVPDKRHAMHDEACAGAVLTVQLAQRVAELAHFFSLNLHRRLKRGDSQGFEDGTRHAVRAVTVESAVVCVEYDAPRHRPDHRVVVATPREVDAQESGNVHVVEPQRDEVRVVVEERIRLLQRPVADAESAAPAGVLRGYVHGDVFVGDVFVSVAAPMNVRRQLDAVVRA